jgi:DNA polymerase-1
MRILLDADMLLFRAMAATEVEVELAPDVWTRHSEAGHAREMYWQQVTNWCDLMGCNLGDVWHCFTDRSAFRRDLFPGYKANRKSPKPIGYKHLRAELLTEDTAFMFSKIEADDLMGIFATMPTGDEVVIASGDKDLMQIPGLHLWLDTGKEIEPEDGLVVERSGDTIIKRNTDEHAERFTYQQILTGDATDGIPGCKGMGPVGAKKLVDGFDIADPVGCWEAIVRAYETKGKVDQPSQLATQQARLVRVLRAGEYNFDTHEVKLWNPPTN